MTPPRTPERLQQEKDSGHLRLMLIHLNGFSLLTFIFWLIRFRPLDENPWVLLAGITLLLIASAGWALLNYQSESTADKARVNARVGAVSVVLLGTTIVLIPTVQYLMMGSSHLARPWVAISKGFANEFAYVVLIISALSFNARIVHSVAWLILVGQAILATLAWSTAEDDVVRTAYANHMSPSFDPGSSLTLMFMTTVVYVTLLSLIRVHRTLLGRIRYVSPTAAP